MENSEADLGRILEESGAILKGHFKLTSGRHSDTYFEKFRVLEQPKVLAALCSQIAAHYADKKIDLVAGPTTGGIIIAHEVARQMGIQSRFVETENGVKTFRRQAQIPTGSRMLIVDDVLTTGLSLKESAEAAERFGGLVAGLAVLIDRSQEFHSPYPLFAAFKATAVSYSEDEIPEWLAKIPVTKPGTRTEV